ncbi:MAG: sensor histidine kinase [Nibricoccus sp.]
MRSSGRNTLSPVSMQCPEGEAVVGENYLVACKNKKPAAGSAEAMVVQALDGVLQPDGKPFALECGSRDPEQPAWHQILIFPLEGAQDGALLMQIDVSERHQAQAELQRSHDEIRSLARRLINAQEEERLRVARELHDDICQRLAVQALQISNLRRNQARNHTVLARKLDQLEKDAVEIGNALRSFSHQLHPVALHKFGLVASIRDFCKKVADQGGLELELQLGSDRVEVAPALAISLFRIVQEALSNVIKHAKASRVRVTLRQDNAGLTLSIEDNGVGFTVDDAPANLGLISMKERARSFSGTLKIDTSPGRGARVEVEIPLNFNALNHETSTYNHF